MSEIKIIHDKKRKNRGGKKFKIHALIAKKEYLLNELKELDKQLKQLENIKVKEEINTVENCKNYTDLIGKNFLEIYDYAKSIFAKKN